MDITHAQLLPVPNPALEMKILLNLFYADSHGSLVDSHGLHVDSHGSHVDSLARWLAYYTHSFDMHSILSSPASDVLE